VKHYLNQILMKFFNLSLLAGLSRIIIYLGNNVFCDLQESLDGIKKLNTVNGVIQFDETQFKKFVNNPRSYSVFVAFTVQTMDCNPCLQATKALEKISAWIVKSSVSDKLFIASLPYEKAPNIFNQYKLQSAPNLYFFPSIEAKSKDPKFEAYKALSTGFDTDKITEFLTEQAGVKISYKKPFPWALYGSILLAALCGFCLIYILFHKFSAILYSTRTWSAITMVFLLTTLSGQMWNSIRGASFAKYKRDGSVEWFSEGFQQQYGFESQIVAVAYGLATLAFIQLGIGAPKIKNPTLQSIVASLLIFIFLTCITFIVTLFKRKFPPYPYKIYFE